MFPRIPRIMSLRRLLQLLLVLSAILLLDVWAYSAGKSAPLPPAPTGCVWERSAEIPHWYALYKGAVQVGGYSTKSGMYYPLDIAADEWLPARPWGQTTPALVASAAKGMHWEAKSGTFMLYDGDKVLGVYDPKVQTFRRYDPEVGVWGESAPFVPGQPVPQMNYGVRTEKLHTGPGEKVSITGRPDTKDHAKKLIQDAPNTAAGSVPDDKANLRLTIIGDPDARKRVLDDMRTNPELAVWSDRLVVKDYARDHWAVKDIGMVTSGNPVTIYLQRPDGKVLHRQDNYDGGAVALAQALRRADPDYKPAADPDLRGVSAAMPTNDLTTMGASVGALGLLGLIGLLKGRKR